MSLSNFQAEFEPIHDCIERVALSKIRETAQKSDYRTKGNILARKWARPTAVYGTWVAIRLGLSAHSVTAIAAMTWLCESVCISGGNRIWFSAGVFFGFAGFWFDHVDGQIARVKKSESLEGIFFDFWIHTAHTLVRAFGLGWGLYHATGHESAILSGMATGFGWLMLSYSNDSKYKALFAHLNSTRSEFKTVDRFEIQNVKYSRAERNPRRIVRWALVKAQEPHVVLLAELVICSIMWVDFSSGIHCWTFFMIFWAVTAPLLAIARLTRYIKSSEISNNFHDWFKQVSET